jgi:hypothetical protein
VRLERRQPRQHREPGVEVIKLFSSSLMLLYWRFITGNLSLMCHPLYFVTDVLSLTRHHWCFVCHWYVIADAW